MYSFIVIVYFEFGLLIYVMVCCIGDVIVVVDVGNIVVYVDLMVEGFDLCFNSWD